MKKQNLNIIIFAALFFLFTLSTVKITFAEDNFKTKEDASSKREITADSLRWEYEAKTAIFTGNVIMKGDEGEISCPKMTIFFDENDGIEKMVAEGKAHLIREKQECGGERIEIYPDQNLLILKQEAWISSDKAMFKGEEINFDTEKEIINITKGVKGEIQTGSEKMTQDNRP
jgi:lipopolysaccharide transport protein LptA